MKTSFPKPYSTPKQIVQILKNRGMYFSDEGKAESYLMNIGYHRLSAYIFPFYKGPKSDLILKEDTTFEQVLTLYRFDKKLRILLFNEIEKIEVAIRSVLANIGCQELGDRYWITKPEYFANEDKFNQTLAVIEKELASSKEDYIENFRHNYVENYPPAWMITEVMSFGNLNYIFQHCQQPIDEAYWRLFRSEATGIHLMADGACQPSQYVLPSCKSMEQRLYVESGRAT